MGNRNALPASRRSENGKPALKKEERIIERERVCGNLAVEACGNVETKQDQGKLIAAAEASDLELQP